MEKKEVEMFPPDFEEMYVRCGDKEFYEDKSQQPHFLSGIEVTT